jgi:non-canonical purine NTP pyrophosphatase (RdgB/HAM1 family)
MQVVLATSNPGKAREARSILEQSGFEVFTVPLWIGEVETGTTYLENARLKAQSAVRLLGRAVLAEDAGIEVDALGGRPGVRSARFAGPAATSAENNAKLLRLLDGVTEEKRTTRYRITAVLLLPSGEEIVGEGTLEGRIIDMPRGEGGFGYDPLFVPDGREQTVAEMRSEEKNVMSHRAQALREIVTRTVGR